MSRTQNLSFIAVVRAIDSSIIALHIDQEDSLSSDVKRHLYNVPTVMRETAVGKSRHLEQWHRGPLFILADETAQFYYCIGSKERTYPERVAFACLLKLKELVTSKTSSVVRMSGTDGALDKQIGKDMKDLMHTYDKLEEVDKLSSVQKQVDATKDVVRQNVEKLTAQAITLENLEERSGNLNAQASQFQSDATTLRKAMQWRNIKVYILGGVIAAVLILYIVLSVTGSL